MSNTGRASQKKGAEGEKELASRLAAEGYPVIWGGNKSYGERPDLRGLPGIHIECKRVERLNIYAAMEQAKTDSARFHDGSPTVFQRRNREEWLVTMPFPDWIRLYKQADRASSLDQQLNTHARFFCDASPSLSDQTPHTDKGVTKMKMRYWESETPIRVDTGKNILEYYPEGGALNVCRPNFEEDGVVHRGKAVALDIYALRNNPEAVKVMKAVIGV